MERPTEDDIRGIGSNKRRDYRSGVSHQARPQRAVSSVDQGRSALRERLEARRQEIERVTFARVCAVGDPTKATDPAYLEGLRLAVSDALGYGLAAIDRKQDIAASIPSTLLAQARVAARNGISLDTVLRRYFAGYSFLGDLLVGEVNQGGLLRGSGMKQLLCEQAGLFDELLNTVSAAYRREVASPTSPEQRRREVVERFLEGGRMDAFDLSYPLDDFHLGIVASGLDAVRVLRGLASTLDRRLLMIQRPEGTVWAWLGSRRPLSPIDLLAGAAPGLSQETAMAIGEPHEGFAGWRFTHRQAKAAFPIAVRMAQKVVRYADVALLAAAIRDDLLATSLRRLYALPLEEGRDGGKSAKETLRAYLASDQNVSATAATLGISRQSVSSRLQTIEARIAQPIDRCLGELDTVLRMEQLRDDSG